MARRDLIGEAQAIGAAQVAPQVAALQNALGQARVDRNAAIRAAAVAYKGLSGAIHRAGPQVRNVYRGAQRDAHATDLIARPAVQGDPTIAAAYAHEGAVGGAVVAKDLAQHLAALSDRRIAAAAGRAFQTQKAISDYTAAAATNAQKMQQVGAQQGAYTAAAFSKLSEAAANRMNQRLLTRERLASSERVAQAHIQSSQDIAAANRSSREHTAALSRRQQRLGRQNQRYLQGQRIQAQKTTQAKKQSAAPSATTIKGRNDIQALVDQYKANPHNYSGVAQTARKAGFHETVIRAASNLASRGYVAPREVKALGDLGVDVPKDWQGVQVPAHTRKRPQVFRP